MTSRRAVLGLMAGAAGAAVLPAPLRAQELQAAARREGRVVVYGSWPAAVMNRLGTAFRAKHGVAVEFTNMPTSQTVQRFVAELEANQPNVDVVQISDLAPYVDFARRNLLLAHRSAEYAAYPERFRDSDGRWVVLAMNAENMIYNTEQVPRERAPKDWADVLRPEFQGRIAAPDIRGGGTGYLFYYAMREIFGVDFHRRLGALRPQLHVGTAGQGQAVLSGEAAAAVGLLHYTGLDLLKQDARAPIGIAWPEPIPLAVRAAGISARAPRPNAAKLFMDFVASDEGQRVGVVGAGSISPRAGLATPGVPDLAARRTFTIGHDQMDRYLQQQAELTREFTQLYL
ncbi:MAG: extracellular solute-binding protein [Alphaproteobacteria bacterium]|nr:extracellular solute-binding protein [Alphaproteobacteria bacterium]